MTEFEATGPACGCCGSATVPPYAGSDGHHYDGFYCAACGAAWTDPTQVVGPCMVHREG